MTYEPAEEHENHETFTRTRHQPGVANLNVSGANSALRMTSQVLVAAATCATKAAYLMRGPKQLLRQPAAFAALPPSAFANEYLLDGRKYEGALFAEKAAMLALINRHLGLTLPGTVRIVRCETGVPTHPEHGHKRQLENQMVYTDICMRLARPGEALIFTQPMLGHGSRINKETYDCGRPDLLIWTGSIWYIGDIKRSEAVTSAHGAQVYYYYDILKRWPHLGEIASRAFIIHCAPGYLYQTRGGKNAREQAVTNSKLALFPLETMRSVYEANYTILENLAAFGHQCRFTRACVECSFRRTCYTEMVLDRPDTPLSLVPLSDTEYQSLLRAGFDTAEALAAAEPDHPELQYLTEGNAQRTTMLLNRAKMAVQLKGGSLWRSKTGWEDSYALYAASEGKGLWYHAGTVADTPPQPLPSVIVAFSDAELRQAKSELWHLFRIGYRESKACDYVCLSEETREKLHLPLLSHTLRATEYFLAALTQGVAVPEIMRAWFGRDWADEDDIPDAAARLQSLRVTWDSLFILEKLCH